MAKEPADVIEVGKLFVTQGGVVMTYNLFPSTHFDMMAVKAILRWNVVEKLLLCIVSHQVLIFIRY